MNGGRGRGKLESSQDLLRDGVRRGAQFALLLALLVFVGGPLTADTRSAPSAPPQELAGKRTEFSATYRNADGTYTTSAYALPINYRDGEGKWQPIDSTLVQSGKSGYAWQNRANSFHVYLKQKLGQDAVAFSRDGGSYTMSLHGAAAAGGAVAASGAAKGRGVGYAGAFPGVDLQYLVENQGLEETLVLKKRSAPTSYTFTIAPQDGRPLIASRSGEGWTFESSRQADPIFVLRPPLALDAHGKDGSRHSTMDVTRNADGTFTVQLSVDPTWFANATLPVRLDPTVEIATKFVADWNANCASCNTTGDPLYIGTDASSVYRAALSFDLSSIPLGAHVTSATASTWSNTDFGDCVPVSGQACGANAHTIEAHLMKAPWDNNSPWSVVSFDPTVLSTFTLPANPTDQWMTWDVTSTAQGWINGTVPNYGILLKRDTEPANAGGPASAGDGGILVGNAHVDVTYANDAVGLYAPQTLHANGAELRWTKWDTTNPNPFGGYEIHRAIGGDFTPSASNLVATIGDVNTTTYVDTTASPSTQFTYKVVVNGVASQPQTVTLPADGHAVKSLALDDTNSQMTYADFDSTQTDCWNYSDGTQVNVGSDGNTSSGYYKFHPLIWFDLRDIPSGATISSATLKVHSTVDWTPGASFNVEAHRLTTAWKLGTGNGCTGDGATWYDAYGGMKWKTQGGDFDSTVVGSPVAVTSGESPRWDTFDITSAVSQWASGAAPNFGLLLKASDETPVDGKSIDYYKGNYSDASLHPQVSVNYTDGSHANAPNVAISSPTGDTPVGGTVHVAAGASDDGQVAKVQFYVDGTLAATSTAAPYGFDWSSAGVADGSHTLKAVATDDAGNQTTSSTVTVTVDNSAAPSTSISSPAASATVNGSVGVNASATDDKAVSHVEFYVDGNRFANDTAATNPSTNTWSAALDTASTAAPVYDGQHTLQTVAYDAGGHVTSSSAVNVTVANAPAGSEYSATYSSTDAPQAMTYDPNATTQQTAGLNVTVTNTSSVAWNAANVSLRARWINADGGIVDAATTQLSGNVAAGGSQTDTIVVSAPTLADGVNRSQYTLRVDLFDSSTGAFFSDQGVKPLENPVIINKALVRDALGLERYYHYTGDDLGGGMQQLVNVANGNSILRWTPFDEPGRGLATVVDLTYNALEKKCDCPTGNNWSLSISSLSRLGQPIDIHPNKADQIAGNANKYVDVTDGDGTTHRFTDSNNDGYWEAPAGVHLYLRPTGSSDPNKYWAFTRPDRVTFYYTQDGFPTSVVDGNGNTLTLTESAIAPADDPGNLRQHVTKVTDAGGRSFDIVYFTRADAQKPQIRGKVKSITDHLGREIDFAYYDDGNLLRITQKGGTNPDGTPLADRTWVFTYTVSDGSGPAIPNAADRVNPDPKTPNESTRIYSVRDPRGHESTFSYLGDGAGINRWKLASYTDRGGHQTTYSYDETNLVTTVTNPLNRVWKYTYDTEGKVTKIDNPLSQDATIAWSGDRQVAKVTEPTGAATSYTYNDNGYLTSKTDQLGNKTVLTYQNLAVDANDNSSHWEAGRTIPHVSQLATKTSPLGVAAGSGYQWQFGYDANGNLTSAKDPLGNTTTSTYNGDGTLASVSDPNGHANSYGAYDANGLPGSITDADGNVTRFGYDAAGETIWAEDANHAAVYGTSGTPTASQATSFYYDPFGRLARQSTPKSTAGEPGMLIWSDTQFDANDNVVSQQAPHFGTSDGMDGAATTSSYDNLDEQTLVTSPNKLADPNGERTAFTYDDAGRLATVQAPNGVQSGVTNADTTAYTYDALDRVLVETAYSEDGTAANSRITHYCYDLAGDLRTVTSPLGNSAFTSCPAQTTPYTPLSAAYTSTFTYDAAHQMLSSKDPVGHTQSAAYDADGNVSNATDGNGVTTTMAYDQLDRMTQQTQPFDTSASPVRNVVSMVQYDPAGNVKKEISPRAYDASTDKSTFTNYVTSYNYDAADRLVRTDLPTDASMAAPLFQYEKYDPNGQMTAISLPTDVNMAPSAIDWSQLGPSTKTTVSYLDPGWVKTENNPSDPAVHFEYRAEGWQISRTPNGVDPATGNDTGVQDRTKRIEWTYNLDGQATRVTEPGGDGSSSGFSTYGYDANGNLTSASENRGVQDQTQAPRIDATMTYDGFDEQTKVSEKAANVTNSNVTTYQYDANGNIKQLVDNAVVDPNGNTVTNGDTQLYTYDGADWLQKELDQQNTPSTTTDDRTILWTYDGEQNPLTQTVQNGSGSTLQQTTWSYFANGLQKTLKTTGGSSGTLLEQHTLGYLDSSGVFENGNLLSDQFTLGGPNTVCKTTACTQKFGYDAMDRLTSFDYGHDNMSTTYTLDPAGDIKTQAFKSGTTTSTTAFTYNGTRLATETDPNGSKYKFRFDPNGNMDCELKDVSGSDFASDCVYATGATPSANLIGRYQYDALSRMTAVDTFRKDTHAADLSSTYTYDPLDRVNKEVEKHAGSAARTTLFGYLGLTNLDAQEKETGGTAAITRNFSYSADGTRVSENYTYGTNAPVNYTFGYNAHGDTSLVVNASGGAQASYGYDAYGNSDGKLTSGDVPSGNTGPINPFRYSGFRLDSGSGTIAMGARRFGPDTSHFLQEDSYAGALDDLGLATDPLSDNRYMLAGANPINFVETDGHAAVAIGAKASLLLNRVVMEWNIRADICGRDLGSFACAQAAQAQNLDFGRFQHSLATPISWTRVLASAFGVTDFLNCTTKLKIGACLWTAGTIVPLGRLGEGVARGLRGIAEFRRVRRALKAGEGIWHESNWARGLELEQRLGGNLPSNFPVIDRFDPRRGVAESIKSIDLTRATYQDSSRLLGKLKRDINALAGFNGRNWGGVRVEADAIRTRRLLVALPPSLPSADQMVALSRAWRYARAHGVALRFTMTG